MRSKQVADDMPYQRRWKRATALYLICLVAAWFLILELVHSKVEARFHDTTLRVGGEDLAAIVRFEYRGKLIDEYYWASSHIELTEEVEDITSPIVAEIHDESIQLAGGGERVEIAIAGRQVEAHRTQYFWHDWIRIGRVAFRSSFPALPLGSFWSPSATLRAVLKCLGVSFVASLGLLSAACMAMSASHRKLSEMCPKCSYNRTGGTGTCPECGYDGPILRHDVQPGLVLLWMSASVSVANLGAVWIIVRFSGVSDLCVAGGILLWTVARLAGIGFLGGTLLIVFADRILRHDWRLWLAICSCAWTFAMCGGWLADTLR